MSKVKEKKENKIEQVQEEKEERILESNEMIPSTELEEKIENVTTDTATITSDETIEETEVEEIKKEEPVVTVLEETETEVEEEIKEQPKEKKDWLHKYSIVIAIISAILIIGLILFSTVFGLSNRNSDKIIAGISIKGMDVSGLTKEQAKEKIVSVFEEKKKQNIVLHHGEYEISLTPEQIETNFGIEEAIEMAYSVGRSGKLLKDNYAIINAHLNKIEITPAFSYYQKALEDFVADISGNLPDKVEQSSYCVEGNNLVISKGKVGVVVKNEELIKEVVNHILALKSEQDVIDIPVETKNPDTIDIEKIHQEIYKEAQDAYYTKDPFTVHPHVKGVDFSISMEEAKNLVAGQEQDITIPLKITTPKVTTNQIGTEAFPNLLATYSTTFSTSNSNRSTNIRLSSNKINGVVLMPGEEFSYNKVVGKRTVQAGYKEAPAYLNGKVVNDVGGGICQVSSTLYNTALRANLAIVKRSNHRFATGYVPLSTDATVSWGGPEFIFKNSRKYPVKIVSTVSGGRIKIDIYGCKEEVEYDVQIKSETLQTIPTKVVYRTNTSLPKGTKKTVQKGHGGYKSRAYRILSLDGKVISKQLLSTDTYAQLETIIEQN